MIAVKKGFVCSFQIVPKAPCGLVQQMKRSGRRCRQIVFCLHDDCLAQPPLAPFDYVSLIDSLTGTLLPHILPKLIKPEFTIWKASSCFNRPSIQTSSNPISKDCPLTLGVLLSSTPRCNRRTAVCLMPCHHTPHSQPTTLLPPLASPPLTPIVNRLVGLGLSVTAWRTKDPSSSHFETRRHIWLGRGANWQEEKSEERGR